LYAFTWRGARTSGERRQKKGKFLGKRTFATGSISRAWRNPTGAMKDAFEVERAVVAATTRAVNASSCMLPRSEESSAPSAVADIGEALRLLPTGS
jgi:hypothetical protein